MCSAFQRQRCRRSPRTAFWCIILCLAMISYFLVVLYAPKMFLQHNRSKIKNPALFTHTGNAIQSTQDVRYVLPLFLWSAGSSSLFNPYKRAIMYALHNNRSIVAIPFHNHKMTQNGGLSVLRPFNETFDVQELAKLLPVASLEEFQNSCGTSLDARNVLFPQFKNETVQPLQNTMLDLYSKLRSLDSDYLTFYYDNMTMFLELHLGISMPPLESVSAYANERGHSDYIRKLKCLGLIPSRDLVLPREMELEKAVNKYWMVASYIRDMVTEIEGSICGGHVTVMHWRNKTGERCGGIREDIHICTTQVINNLEILSNATPGIVQSVIHALNNRNRNCLYLASPPYAQELVTRLKESSLHVFTKYDLFNISSRIRKYKDDNYVLSLIEQELAMRAEFFISSRTSNWSLFVESQRVTKMRESAPLYELPGIPKELLEVGDILEHII